MLKGLWRTTLVITLSATTALAFGGASAFAETSTDVQKKIDKINQKQQKNQGSISQYQSKLSKNKSQQDKIISQIKASEKKINTLSTKIDSTEQKVKETQSQIDQLNKQIDVIKQRIAKRDEILKQRVKTMYINGGAINPMTVLLGSKSFGNFLDRVLALGLIAKQDKSLLEAQKKDKAEADKKKQQVEDKMKQIQSDLSKLKSMKSEVDKEKATNEALLKKLQDNAKEINKNIMSKKETATVLSDQKAALKKEKARVAVQEAAARRPKVSRSSAPAPAPHGQAMFIKPAAGIISQGYGQRPAPEGGFHPGIDIANAPGTPIHAAASGTVFRAYLSSSYGNCVMITHNINGQVYTTVYAHMEHFVVTGGQTVTQGQVIGYMGSTGDSTGPHLHFEMYKGPWNPPPHPGTVNPLNYIQ